MITLFSVIEAGIPMITLFSVISKDGDNLYKWQTFRPIRARFCNADYTKLVALGAKQVEPFGFDVAGTPSKTTNK